MKAPYQYGIVVHYLAAMAALVLGALIIIYFQLGDVAAGFTLGSVTVWLVYNAYLTSRGVTAA